MLLSISECSWNWWSKVTLLLSSYEVNETTFTRVMWNRVLFEVKKAVVNSVCFVTRTRFTAFLWLAERNVTLRNKEDFGITHFACAGNIIYLSKEHQLSRACRDVCLQTFISCRGSFQYLFHLPLPASLMWCLSGYGIVTSQTLPGQEQSNRKPLTVVVSVSQYSVVKVILSNKCYLH